MKNKVNIHPLLCFLPSDDLDAVLAPNMEIVPQTRTAWKARFDSLVQSHVAGVQRMGVVPSVGTMHTNFLAIEFSACNRPGAPGPLESALRVERALRTEQLVFADLPANPEHAILETMRYNVPVCLERQCSLQVERYMLWFLFGKPIERATGHLALQSLLVGLGIDSGVRVLPYPHYRAGQSLDDAVWLPLFTGTTHYIHGELVGGIREGRSVFLDLTKTPPVPTEAPSDFERIAPKEFERLTPVLAPNMSKARAKLPNPPQPPQSPVKSREDEMIPPDLTDAGAKPGSVNTPDPSTQIGPSEMFRQPARELILQTARNDLEPHLRLLDGMGIFNFLSAIRRIIAARAMQVPAHLFGMWGEALAEVLGVDLPWVADLFESALMERAATRCSLQDLLERAEFCCPVGNRRAVLVMRWIKANGGEFTRTDRSCALRWEGTDHQIELDSSFAALFWQLTGARGNPMSLADVFESVLQESLRLGDKCPTNVPSMVPESSALVQLEPFRTVVDAIEQLLENAERTETEPNSVLESMVSITLDADKVIVSALGTKMCPLLNLSAGCSLFGGTSDMSRALAQCERVLIEHGILVEVISKGKRKPREFRISRARRRS